MNIRGYFLAIIIIAALSPTISSAKEKADTNMADALVIAKVTGMCGILNLQVDFQRNTSMPGGDEFIDRFWATEVARRGITREKLIEQCNQAIPAYEKIFSLALSNEK